MNTQINHAIIVTLYTMRARLALKASVRAQRTRAICSKLRLEARAKRAAAKLSIAREAS